MCKKAEVLWLCMEKLCNLTVSLFLELQTGQLRTTKPAIIRGGGQDNLNMRIITHFFRQHLEGIIIKIMLHISVWFVVWSWWINRHPSGSSGENMSGLQRQISVQSSPGPLPLFPCLSCVSFPSTTIIQSKTKCQNINKGKKWREEIGKFSTVAESKHVVCQKERM